MTSSTTPSERSIGFLGFMVMLAKNPFNHVGMTQKLPYMPILVVLGPKLWSVTLKLCRRAKLSVPFLVLIFINSTQPQKIQQIIPEWIFANNGKYAPCKPKNPEKKPVIWPNKVVFKLYILQFS